MDRFLCVLDVTGKIVVWEVAKSNARRISMQGAADQRQLDVLIGKTSNGKTAEIRWSNIEEPTFSAKFQIVGGKSQHVGETS